MNTHEEIERMRQACLNGNMLLFEHMVERLRTAAKWQEARRRLILQQQAQS